MYCFTRRTSLLVISSYESSIHLLVRVFYSSHRWMGVQSVFGSASAERKYRIAERENSFLRETADNAALLQVHTRAPCRHAEYSSDSGVVGVGVFCFLL